MTKSIVAARDKASVQPFPWSGIARAIANEGVCVTHCVECILAVFRYMA